MPGPRPAKLAGRWQREWDLFRADFFYACRYLKLIDKQTGRLVSLEPNVSQAYWHAHAVGASHTFTLKTRKEGISSYIAAYFFWQALTTKNFGVLVVSENEKTAAALLDIYKRYYEELPKALRARIPTTNWSATEVQFYHGGHIESLGANSKSRGLTKHAIHFSEFAFYENITKTIAAMGALAAPFSVVHLETTANGLNDAYHLWATTSRWKKVFIPWTIDPMNTLPAPPGEIPAFFQELQREHKLTDGQVNWAVDKYHTASILNLGSWRQEFGLTPEMCFVSSGHKYFPEIYETHEWSYGARRYVKARDPGRVHVMGVDAASGSPESGRDNQAWAILDVTDTKKIGTIATYYGRVPLDEFCQMAYDEAVHYDALVVIEANSYGLAAIEFFINHQYPRLFVNPYLAKMQGRYSTRYGLWTGGNTRPLLLARMREYVARGWFKPFDMRLMAEMNAFAYDKHTGRPDAPAGQHDDLIFATALALIGADQAYAVAEDYKENYKPESIEDLIRYETLTGDVRGRNHDAEIVSPSALIFD